MADRMADQLSLDDIAKDGDCCFRAVARNVSKLTETGGLSSQAYEHMANLGLVNLDEESLSDSLRVLTVSEWSGGQERTGHTTKAS